MIVKLCADCGTVAALQVCHPVGVCRKQEGFVCSNCCRYIDPYQAEKRGAVIGMRMRCA